MRRIYSRKLDRLTNERLKRENGILRAVAKDLRDELKEKDKLLHQVGALVEGDIAAMVEVAEFLKTQEQTIEDMEKMVEARDKEIAELKAKLSRKAKA